MNRIIKFRGWYNNEMVDLKKITPLALDSDFKTDGLFIPFLEGFEIMQFTGLLDKNGKEIYCGDILKRSKEIGPNFLVLIEFKKGMFGGTTYPMRNHFIEMPRLPHCDYNGGGYDEVIGNIYENPELLK